MIEKRRMVSVGCGDWMGASSNPEHKKAEHGRTNEEHDEKEEERIEPNTPGERLLTVCPNLGPALSFSSLGEDAGDHVANHTEHRRNDTRH
jgi:hypothetical protein